MSEARYSANSAERIYNITVLKGKCLNYNQELLAVICDKFDLPPEFAGSTFFTAMSDVLDVLLFIFLNEEVSASLEKRGPLGDILAKSIERHYTESDHTYLSYCDDIQHMFSKRVDFVIGSCLLDFTVSSFSVFEKWVCSAYEEVRQRRKSSNKKIAKLRKMIGKYNSITVSSPEKELALKRIMDNRSSYISGFEKINFTMSKVDHNYLREKQKDLETIEMYSKMRNTIHNLGIHINKQQYASNTNNCRAKLEPGKAYYTDTYSHNIHLCNELVEIYKAMICSLDLCSLSSLIELGDRDTLENQTIFK
ncbi:MAG: hypothetical protein ACLGJC_21105 [Alphaproteobacteria bacterium]